MTGLLDAFSTPDAQLGFGLLAAAAPSMAPMNLAGRLAQGNKNFKDLTAADLANQTSAQNLQMNNIALQRQQQEWGLQLPMLQAMSARLSGNPQQPAAPSQAPAAPPQIGTNQTLGGQPLFSSGVTSTPQQAAPQSAPQPQPAPAQSQGASMFPGVPDSVAYPTAAFGGFKALLPLLAQYNTPTDATKMANAAGVDPRAANQAALTKSTYIAPVNARPGSILRDPITNLPLAFNPHVPQNATPLFDASGNVVGMKEIPGANSLIQSNAQAMASGKAAVTPQAGFDANGRPTFTSQLSAATGSAQNGRYPGSAVAPTLTPSAQAAGTEAGKGSGQLYNTDNSAANGYATRMFALGKALTGLQGADTGPGSDAVNGIKSLLMAQSPAWLAQHIPGVNPSKISSYDEANKYLIQYAMGQVGSMGEGTDSKLATTLSGNANTHISNLAAQDVVKASAGLERMRNAQINQFNQTGLPPDQYQKWATQWNQTINPQVFVWDSLDGAKKAAAAKNMTAAQRQNFTAQYNWALQNKFIDGSQ